MTHAPVDPVALTADLIRCPSVTPVEGGALVLLQQMDQRHPQWDGSSQRKHTPPSHRSGVNAFGRQMAEQFAADGYLVVAPSLFSRGLSGLDYGYRYDHNRWSVRLRRPLDPLPSGPVMLDVEAAIVHARRLAPHCAIGAVGYCWGGLLAWRAASEFRSLQAAVCHYGGGMATRTLTCLPAIVGAWRDPAGGAIAARCGGRVEATKSWAMPG